MLADLDRVPQAAEEPQAGLRTLLERLPRLRFAGDEDDVVVWGRG
ncbi:hypothetical protein [Saccharopolyspora sp. NPDC050642]